MKKLSRFLIVPALMVVLVAVAFVSADFLPAQAVQYDLPARFGTSTYGAKSIDECLRIKKWHFNERFSPGFWVDRLVRCEKNKKGVLSKAVEGTDPNTNYTDVSLDPADEQACKGKRAGSIIVNGTPSENWAETWSKRCSYLGTLGGAGPYTGGNAGNGFFNFGPSTGRTTTGTPSRRTPAGGSGDGAAGEGTSAEGEEEAEGGEPRVERRVYTGPGIRPPNPNDVAEGISRETSLATLIIGFTNWLLPYVSILSIFAFVAAGMFYILSFVNEDLNNKAKTIMLYVVIGIIIIFSSYTIVNTLLSLTQ